MEKDKRIVWLLFALGFIGILLIASLIILNNYNKENLRAFSPQIINSYNFYENQKIEYNIINPIKTIQYTNQIERERIHYYGELRDYFNYRDYSGQERRREFLGNYVQEYYVYILNKEKTGEYFTVIFEFEDKNGYEYSESITQYIRAGEKEKFTYRDIQSERNEIVDWGYEVIPEEC